MVLRDHSIVILVSASGSVLDGLAVQTIPAGRIVEADFAATETVCCAALQLSHDCSREELQVRLRAWARARGWMVAVAPGPETG
jgi:hypothetical protein